MQKLLPNFNIDSFAALLAIVSAVCAVD